jgi:hypothetical protein
MDALGEFRKSVSNTRASTRRVYLAGAVATMRAVESERCALSRERISTTANATKARNGCLYSLELV